MLAGTRARVARTCALVLLLAAPAAQAQVQRSFINQSFEQPATCNPVTQMPAAHMPGWETTHAIRNDVAYCGSPAMTDRPIETWQSGFNGVSTAPGNGNQFVELNAYQASRLYQTVCLVPGERVTWQMDHRGRSGADTMSFNIGPNPDASGAVEIVRVISNTSGGGSIVAGSCGMGGTCTVLSAPGSGWSRYAGEFTWTGAAGEQTVGFQAISAAGGVTVGNFLDGIHLVLRPYAEFFPSDASSPEDAGSDGIPHIRVAGVIENTFDVTVQITGGTATLGTDYTAPGTTFTVTIPTGDYGTGQDFPLPLTVLDDSDIEGDETVTLSLVPDPDSYAIGSTASCGAPANADITWTIVDDDHLADLSVLKSADADVAIPGQQLVYTLAVRNDGPGSADGAMVRDQPGSGLDCGGGTLTCGNATGGAVCPVSPEIDDLLDTGVAIPTLPPDSSLEFQLTCTVTGAP